MMDYQQTEEESNRFFNLSLDMMCITTLNGYFIKLNPVWQTTLGYSIEELKRTPFINFVHPEDQAKTQAEFEQLLGGGITPNFENRYRCQDGSYKWFSWTAIPIIESGVVYAIARDITKQKQSEIMSSQLAAIVKSSEDAIISKTLEGIIESWNRSAERIFGYSAEEMVGHSIELLIPDERRDEEPEILKRLKQGEQIEHFETVRKRKDGALIHISLTISPIKDAAGQIIGASKIAREISDRKQIEIALRSSEEQFRQQAEREHIVREVAQRIRRSLNLDEILNTTVVEIRNLLYADRVFIYQFEPDWSGIITVESVDSNWRSVLGQVVDDTFFKRSEGRGLYEQGQIQAVADIYTSGLADCHLQILEQFQIRANLVVPILQ